MNFIMLLSKLQNKIKSLSNYFHLKYLETKMSKSIVYNNSVWFRSFKDDCNYDYMSLYRFNNGCLYQISETDAPEKVLAGLDFGYYSVIQTSLGKSRLYIRYGDLRNLNLVDLV